MKNFIVILFVFTLLGASIVYGGVFHPSRTHLIDWDRPTNNILFRGSEPLNATGAFVYNELVASMKKAALLASVPFPNQPFQILDLSLLLVELKNIAVERHFFKQNPSLGRYLEWPIIGALLGPQQFPAKLRDFLAKNMPVWDIDRLHSRMEVLHGILHPDQQQRQQQKQASQQPLLIYLHCEAGEDRTGEMSGAYYMRWLNWTFHEALAYDDHNENRLIYFNARNAFNWYCYYLKLAQSRPWLNCTVPYNETGSPQVTSGDVQKPKWFLGAAAQ